MNSQSDKLMKWLPIISMVIGILAIGYMAHIYSTVISPSIDWRRMMNVGFYETDQAGWHQTWLGVPVLQNPCDNQEMQELCFEIKPDIIIEAGTYKGGSALHYATFIDQFKPTCKILTIDTEPDIEAASKYAVWKKHVIAFKGSSTDPAIVDKIKQQIPKNAVVLVTLDSDHHRDHVYKELQIYSQLVSPGSYLVLQDTNINGHPVLKSFGPGPMEALDDFMKENHNFVSDRGREKYILTYYPKGWLKRVR